MIVDYYGELKNMDPSTAIRKNFTLKELANNKGNAAIPQFILDKRVDVFLDMIQEFREWFAKPMTVNCCFRQQKFNSTLKGADPASAHTHACAMDWGITGHSDVQRNNVKTEWFALCQRHGVIGAINYYKNGYHLEAFSNVWYGSKSNQLRDYRGTPSDW